MRKALLAVAVAGTLAVTFGAQAQDTPDGYQLEQVLINFSPFIHPTKSELAHFYTE